MEYKTTVEKKTTTAVIATTYTHREGEYLTQAYMSKIVSFKNKQLYWNDLLKKEKKHDCNQVDHNLLDSLYHHIYTPMLWIYGCTGTP